MSGQAQPGWRQLAAYRQPWLPADLLAGITVAAYLIPQCLAYGELAGVDPVRGLWAILPPLLLYALLGSSPQLSVGPESTTAVMTAAAIAPLTDGDPLLAAGLASLLALLVGLTCCLAAWARIGFVADLLSRPILLGYMAGVAVIMISGQLGRVCGLDLQAEGLLGELGELLGRRAEIHGPTLLLALAVLGFLLWVPRRFPRAPGPLLAVLLATAAVALCHLDCEGIAVIGMIPAGLPRPALPQLPPQEAWQSLLASALGIALVGFSDNILTARAFAGRGGYRVDPNQELLALGASNLGNGLLQGFPVSSSGSRTAIGAAMGSRSQLFSLTALAVVLAVLVALRPLLALFPKAALGAIVIVAAIRLIDVDGFRQLRRLRASEFQLALATTLGVLLTNLLVGVALAVGLSVIDLLGRIIRPNDAVIGEVPNLPGFHDVRDWEGASTRPGLLIYRYDAPLCFANAEHFEQRCLEALEAEEARGLAPVRWLVLNAEAIVDIDSTAAAKLQELIAALEQRGIQLALARVKQDLYATLQRGGLVERLGGQWIFPTIGTAVAAYAAAEHAAAAAAEAAADAADDAATAASVAAEVSGATAMGGP
ncbi:MAG: sulfate permease [Cyanobacteriota bacterium]